MEKSKTTYNDGVFEMLEDQEQFVVISVHSCGVSLCFCRNDQEYAYESIFAADIPAWNRKTGIEK